MANKASHVGLMTDKEIAAMLAERLTKERKVKNLTQKALAEKAGLSLPTVRLFERTGKISLERLIALLRALGRLNTLQELFDFNAEYRLLGHAEYQEILKKQNAGSIRQSSKPIAEEW